MNLTEAQQIKSVLESPAFVAAKIEADNARVDHHRKAVDALLTGESDTSELEAAAAAFAEAGRVVDRLEPEYLAARARRAEAYVNRCTAEWQQTHRVGLLRSELAKHLPSILAEVESAIRLVEADIRAAFTVREIPPVGWKRGQTITNSPQVDAAHTAVANMREALARFSMEPASESEVVAELSRLAKSLIDAGRTAGAVLAFRLPKSVREGVPSAKPERTEPVQIAIQGYWAGRLPWHR